MLSPVFIKAYSISDAWFQLLYKLVDDGRFFTIDSGEFEGNKRLELDFVVVHIVKPDSEPMIPQLPPLLNVPSPISQTYIDNIS